MRVLVVGLGNPNMDFTRHNVGADLLKILTKGYVKQIDKNLYELNENLFFLVAPETVNSSGVSIKRIFYEKECTNLIVLADELDMPYGSVKKTYSKSARGHNGIRSLLEYFPEEFWQILIGIGRPIDQEKESVSSHVLGRFTDEELKQFPAMAHDVGELIFEIVSHIKSSFEI